MSKGLVIVESPAKAKTIQKYLGAGYEVEASLGHIKDLPKKSLGVDLDNDFSTEYVVIPGKEKVVAKLKKLAKSAMPSIWRLTRTAKAKPSLPILPRSWRRRVDGKKARRVASQYPPRHLQRDHQARRAGCLPASPRHRPQSGGRAADPARAGSAGGLPGFSAVVGQGSPRALRWPCADGRPAAHRGARTRHQGVR